MDDHYPLPPGLDRAPVFCLEEERTVSWLTDLMADQSCIRFLRPLYPSLTGVISTRARVLELARKAGFVTILCLFLLDGESLASGLRIMSRLQSDALEILLGIIFPELKDPFIIEQIPPLISGGLSRTPPEMMTIIQAGAQAVLTSPTKLWTLNKDTNREQIYTDN